MPALIGVIRGRRHQLCAEIGVESIVCSHSAHSSAGAEELAHAAVRLAERDGKPPWMPCARAEPSR
jgi:hypothetical protein